MLPHSLSVCWIYYMIFWKLSDVSELHIQHTSFIAFGVFFLRTCISCKVEQMFTSQLTWIVFPVNSTVTTLRARPTLLQLLCFHFESTLRLVRNVIIILKYTNTAVATFKQIIVLVTTPPIDFFLFFYIKICHESFPLAVYVCDKQFTVTVSVCW